MISISLALFLFCIPIISLLATLAFLHCELCFRCLSTLPRDFKGYFRLRRLQREMEEKWAENRPIGWHFLEIVQKMAEKECIIEADTGRSITFGEMNELANKFGNYLGEKLIGGRSVGPIGGDHPPVLAILLDNCIEFVAIWLGLSKRGIATAWINAQLRMTSLGHSVRAANCCAIVTSAELLPALLDAISAGLITADLKVYCIEGNGKNEQNNQRKCSTEVIFLDKTKLDNGREPGENGRKIGFQDTLAYLYTSGTTGSPKAVVIRHYRYYYMGIAGPIIYGIRREDRLYIPLPMYHGMAGIAGIGQMVVNGCCAIIRAKFSARRFWRDCAQHNATIALYIGEICRYLLSQPICEEEKRHNLRMFCGLGLRGAVWNQFRQRFGVKSIGELYGATEGNACLVNITYQIGACGFWPIYTQFMRNCSIRLVKVNPITGEYQRDQRGLCMLCCPGELGEIVGMIRTGNPTRRFEGYLDKTATEKKIIRNVEEIGDCAFASGDILRWDLKGFLYFVDRLGDTYRWRGENVSTTEVEETVQDMGEVEELCVVGVEVPREEGRAGMMAVVLREGSKVEDILEEFARRFRFHLASFAIPQFVRFFDKIPRTGTFKLRKAELREKGLRQQEGEDGEGKMYIWNRERGRYDRMDRSMD